MLPLLSWGAWGFLASLVAPPTPMGFILHGPPPPRVSPLLSRPRIIARSTSRIPFPKGFLQSSLVVIIITRLLHLLGGILMCLHLWRLCLRSLLCRCVLCLMGISLLLWRRALPCPLCRPAFPPRWFRPPPPPGLTTPAPAPSSSLVPAPLAVSFWSFEPFKLPIIKDAKAYLDVHNMIQYYLRQPEYSTQRSDDVLVTSPSNVAASLFWEGQLRNAVREGSLWFLFENKGTLYHGKGFEMLAALDQHCRLDSITNAFCTLMSLFNDVQGSSEAVFEFCSRFDGMVMDLSCSKIILPPILLVMLFLRALHSCYSDILDQFWSRYKKLEAATIDSVVEDIRYHDEFKLVGSDKKTPGGSTPGASAANVNKSGKEWALPFEWLSTYDTKRIKVRWDRAIAGTGICPICHRTEKP
jgi:hypothetical protein